MIRPILLASSILLALGFLVRPLPARAQAAMPALGAPTPVGGLPTPPSAAAPAAGTAAHAAELAKISTYLNGLHALHARFLQIAPDGATSTGTAWLERPGRMRFQYNPPSPVLLVAGYGLLVFHDSQLDQTTNIPLDRTPLGILLADHVRLSGPVTVTSLKKRDGLILLTVVRTDSPGEGSLTLVFNADPLSLRSWITTDAQHQQTRISLYDIKLGGHFSSDLFTYIDPRMLNGGGGG